MNAPTCAWWPELEAKPPVHSDDPGHTHEHVMAGQIVSCRGPLRDEMPTPTGPCSGVV